jgi:hypothetical protein
VAADKEADAYQSQADAGDSSQAEPEATSSKAGEPRLATSAVVPIVAAPNAPPQV